MTTKPISERIDVLFPYKVEEGWPTDSDWFTARDIIRELQTVVDKCKKAFEEIHTIKSHGANAYVIENAVMKSVAGFALDAIKETI